MKELTGTIFNIERFHTHDGEGIRTLVFLKGCLLECPWCCNPESQEIYPQLGTKYNLCVGCGACVKSCPQKAVRMEEGRPITDSKACSLCGKCIGVCLQDAREIYGKQMTAYEVHKEVVRDESFFRRSGGGVTFSGGEPCLQAEFVEECSRLCRLSGVDVNIETCGAVSYEKLERTVRHASLVLMDIKLLDERFSSISYGLSPDVVTDNLSRLVKSGKNVRIRCPIIPGYNDKPEFISKVIDVAKHNGIGRVDLLPFHQFGSYKYESLNKGYILKDVPPLKESDIESFRQMILQAGIQSVTGG